MVVSEKKVELTLEVCRALIDIEEKLSRRLDEIEAVLNAARTPNNDSRLLLQGKISGVYLARREMRRILCKYVDEGETDDRP